MVGGSVVFDGEVWGTTIMATIYDLKTAEIITDGLQGSRICAEAIKCAYEVAESRNATVILDDDDGEWLVGPRGRVRRFTAALKRKYGFSWNSEEGDDAE